MDLFEYDKSEGVKLLCGVDEAGRGPLAGDVYAAAVILPQDCFIDGLNDSKKLSEKKRELLYDIIVEKALAYCVGTASVEEIDELNILNATFLAMQRAVSGLTITPKLVLVDGNQNPKLSVHSRLVVKGDATSASIAAASILAKVSRDRYMGKLAKDYPQYQFEKHKGYGTALHYQTLNEFGASPVHRKTFLKNLESAHKAEPDKSQLNKSQLQEAQLQDIHKKSAGILGEDYTCKYLVAQGYEIVCRNYSGKFGEIDIIAKSGNYIAFVEVKTRIEDSLTLPCEAVGNSKQDKIRKTATSFLIKNDYDFHDLQPRFDVAEVYIKNDEQIKVSKINYIENAFGDDKYDRFF